MKIEVHPDDGLVARKGAAVIAGDARAAVAARGRFIVAVSGGRTPWLMLRALANEQLPWENVPTPEWAGDGPDPCVRVRALTARERDFWEMGNYDLTKGKESKVTMDNSRARLFVLAAIDEKGDRLFQDSDAGAVGKLHSAPLDRAYEVIRRLSGMTADEAEAIRKNSVPAPSDASPAP